MTATDLCIKYIVMYQKDLEMVGEKLLCKTCQLPMQKPYKDFIPTHLNCKLHLDNKNGLFVTWFIKFFTKRNCTIMEDWYILITVKIYQNKFDNIKVSLFYNLKFF